jgi:8-oxo-dGTP pyrophosphatase MutT (NUDIX family)
MAETRWKPSVTVAAIAWRTVEGTPRYLLVEEHTAEGLRLNNPAGHLDPGESPLQAVVRECLEETACAFVPQALLGVYLSRFVRPAGLGLQAGSPAEDITYLRFAYTGTVGEPEPGRALDTGIVRALWLTADEMRASADRHRSPLVLRCLDDLLAGVRHPLDTVWADPSLQQPRRLG